MSPSTSPSQDRPAATAQASASAVEQQLARLFRHCAQAGRIHPLQHLIQLHLQGRKP